MTDEQSAEQKLESRLSAIDASIKLINHFAVQTNNAVMTCQDATSDQHINLLSFIGQLGVLSAAVGEILKRLDMPAPNGMDIDEYIILGRTSAATLDAHVASLKTEQAKRKADRAMNQPSNAE